MYTKRFFASKLGHAALVSIAAMITFIALSGAPEMASAHGPVLVGSTAVELA